MKIREAARLVLGSVIVYAAIAACASARGDADDVGDAGKALDAFVDTLRSPVSEASAEPESYEVACHVRFKCGDEDCLYAEHHYPGASIPDLAAVVAFGRYAPNTPRPGNYRDVTIPTHVVEGKVAALCGPATLPTFTSVMFVRR